MEPIANYNPPVVLTIAGTDSSGGAGVQADLKTFTSLRCYGASVVTALTAQNTTGVQAVYAPPAAFVEKQLRSVLDDLKVDAMKTGMLFNAEIAQTIANVLQEYFGDNMPPLVIDPVCISTSGHTLLEPEAISIFRDKLLRLAYIVTPNIPEAEFLLSAQGNIKSVADMLTSAKDLSAFGSKAILLKGGHITTTVEELQALSKPGISVHWAHGCIDSPDSILILEGARRQGLPSVPAGQEISQDRTLIVDVLYQTSMPDTYNLFVRPRINTENTHGTGCTLAAALASELAIGKTVLAATRTAIDYTHLAIATAFPLGKGHGPLNHFHGVVQRPLARPHPSNPYPFTSAMIHGSYDLWQDYVQHPFVKALGSGALRKESFTHFIKQDYHYLRYYGRAHGLLAAKSMSFSMMKSAALTILAVARETSSHIAFCHSYGVSMEDLVNTVEVPATTAYGGYLIDVAVRGDETILLVAVAACLLGYGEVGLWLKLKLTWMEIHTKLG
ncbi:hypothetical protein M422DRAFT_76537 [Sphaerobolus stellatus SS14]|uniref:Phosphomethylpyrimidine kinase n=1 Tax=Sphaerobolus stellatus (strain SS14) TaxID=990650 RepID=A0A0C9UTA1_SPHS4|nr:hypothetical protein M422DRAFT_76537 [Sphaerobolus stellatus SS14]